MSHYAAIYCYASAALQGSPGALAVWWGAHIDEHDSNASYLRTFAEEMQPVVDGCGLVHARRHPDLFLGE